MELGLVLRQAKIAPQQLEGVDKILARFDGSDDEGFVTGVQTQPEKDLSPELAQQIEDAAFEVVESYQPGWEINEGSYGTVIFDFKTRKVTVQFHARSYREDYS